LRRRVHHKFYVQIKALITTSDSTLNSAINAVASALDSLCHASDDYLRQQFLNDAAKVRHAFQRLKDLIHRRVQDVGIKVETSPTVTLQSQPEIWQRAWESFRRTVIAYIVRIREGAAVHDQRRTVDHPRIARVAVTRFLKGR
jgi:hypothetical protein